MLWKIWKKGFNTWEKQTAKYLEEVLKSPLILGPSGKMLTLAMKTKSKQDEAAARWWGTLGLPTKHDQERTLHALNQLQSRIYDLEEQLHDLKATEVSSESAPSESAASAEEATKSDGPSA